MKTSEVRNKVEELIEVLVDTEHFITFLATDCFDPSYLSVGQITRKLGFSASHWLANKRSSKNPTQPLDSW